mmetsp:Transcript_12957/g.20071  ORF Transcript_12957/g.20071 Transcript_12957/m.20071 type:complete len:118 (-) Transcript_12957:460-813(-)
MLDIMNENDYIEEQREQAQLRDLFRDDSYGYQPVIIKAAQAGALETLRAEADKIIGNQFKVQIVAEAVGPITDKEMSEAAAMGAVIIGFDIPVSAPMKARAESLGVTVSLHKLIYKF